MKLKSRLVLGNMLMVILTMGCLSVSQFFISSYFAGEMLEKTSDSMSERFVAHAREKAEQSINYLSEALLNPMYFYDVETIHQILEPALKDSSTLEIKVFDNKGVVIHTGSELTNDYGMALKMPSLEKTVLTDRKVYVENEMDVLSIAQPLILNTELLGGVMMKYSLKAIQEDIQNNKSIITDINQLSRQYSTLLLAVITILMCLISLALSVLMANTLIAPITRLVRHSKRISKGQYLTPNNIHRNDELGQLANSFNEMDSNLKQRTDAIEFLAYHDPLTKLPNRTQFIEFLDKKLTSEKDSRFAIFFIDLDEFKRVNDNLGHQAGDELLCKAAERIRDSLGKTSSAEKFRCDSLLARVGGDEFLLYLSDVNEAAMAYKFASAILNELDLPIFLDAPGESVVVGASIGIAFSTGSDKSSEELVRNADIAMYAAKAGGKRDYSLFNCEMEELVTNRGEIERDLRLALSDFSQFELVYQPKIDLKSGQITGAEALLRWQHPDKGYISPVEFIPVAEATGIINPLGEWVIEQTCRDIQKWSDLFDISDFHVALNLSAKQLYARKVTDLVRLNLRNFSLPSSCLHVEVTETALMLDKQSAKKTLDSLRSLGIEVWLDDFGTGYSSLGYLREFNIDGLKIDRSFVSDIEDDKKDRALCSAMISLAHQLGIQVVAEGIETTKQSDFLTKVDCDYGQGYLFDKPMSADALAQKLRSQTTPDNVVYIS
ncbi:EAL domain-containing protein [Vibrio sp. JC009]|uniref:bifunctional diguanylate cyclase/phosphodiesterase n=1 Tax=Vibrio sp. JC009 TaxID=2912314 RepID=UPI0023AEB185|nr:EAL domain-containing protein [Vibrio sp. JC009]WED24292.1 EAL domain-containing protein [Vibrio sp. JC009]